MQNINQRFSMCSPSIGQVTSLASSGTLEHGSHSNLVFKKADGSSETLEQISQLSPNALLGMFKKSDHHNSYHYGHSSNLSNLLGFRKPDPQVSEDVEQHPQLGLSQNHGPQQLERQLPHSSDLERQSHLLHNLSHGSEDLGQHTHLPHHSLGLIGFKNPYHPSGILESSTMSHNVMGNFKKFDGGREPETSESTSHVSEGNLIDSKKMDGPSANADISNSNSLLIAYKKNDDDDNSEQASHLVENILNDYKKMEDSSMELQAQDVSIYKVSGCKKSNETVESSDDQKFQEMSNTSQTDEDGFKKEFSNNQGQLSPSLLPDYKKARPYQCTECSYSFAQKNALTWHISSVHEKERPFQCAECSSAFGRKDALSRHVSAVHRKIKPYQCPECPSCFAQKDALTWHISSVHEKNRPFQCPQCSSCFGRKDVLSLHISSVHQDIRPYQCPECYNSFAQKDALNWHISCVHKKERPFHCQECSSTFGRKDALNRHISIVHRKIKPFQCSDCTVAFGQKDALMWHVSSVHKKMRPFHCPECSSAFGRKDALSRHFSIVHKKIKPFQCPECSFSFGQKDALFWHISTVHENIKPFQCSDCPSTFGRKDALMRHYSFVHKKQQPVDSS